MAEADQNTKPAKGKIWRRWLIQAGVSFAVLGVLLWFAPIGEIGSGIAQVPLLLFAGVVLLFLTAHLVAALKWWLLIGRVIPPATAIKAHYIGLTANLCLPGVAGGDAARIAVAWKPASDRSRLAAGSLSDRLIDLAALGAIALTGAILAQGQNATLAWRVVPIVLAICVLGLIIGPRILGAVWAKIPSLPAQGFVRKTCDAFADISARPLMLIGLLLLSIIIQLALITLALQLARATGVDVSFAAWAFAWALAKLIVVLPVSLGGLGVREALLATLLLPYGATTANVVAGGLAWQAVLFVSGAVGAALLARSGLWGDPRNVNGSKAEQIT